MKKILKWAGIVLGGLVALLFAAVVVANVLAAQRLNRQYDIQVADITIPDSAAALARGEHLVEVVSHCGACHGPDLGGSDFFDDPMLGTIPGPNLTSGQGGIGARYSDSDWVRALVHGVSNEGRMLVGMPSLAFSVYSQEDLGAMIAYLKSLPPVDRQMEPKRQTLMGSVLLGLGAMGQMPAEVINHSAPRVAGVKTGATAEYGGYLVSAATCKECHMQNLAGGRAVPTEPYASNLTPGGDLGSWSEADFFTAMRTGMLPSGRALIPQMQWQVYAQMTDEELRAIWLYLQSQPALPDNQ
jgi:mono/diheme cytochrome c family protein